MPLLLFIGLFLWSCEEDLPKDCLGVAGGDAEIDECGVCDEYPGNDCAEDCAGVWGGDNICGCTDTTSISFDSTATYDDGSCLDCAGVAGGDAVCGCTDDTATNFDQNATFDDGSCSHCDTDTTFSRVLRGSKGNDIIRSSGCSYVVCGSDTKTMLLKIDERGNEIWARTYWEISGSHWGESVNSTSDGGFIIGGYRTVIKTDSSGLIEWHYNLPYSNKHYIEDLIQTFEGDYIVVGGVGGDPSTGGHNQKGQAYILRLSEGGGVQWVKRYGIRNTPMDNFWGVVQADDGGFVLAGNKLHDRNFEFYDHFWIMKTDGNGDEVWSHELGGNYWDEAQDIVKLSDDSYVVVGKRSLSKKNLNFKIVRVSASGSILWQNDHGNSNYDTATSVTVTEDEGVIVAAGYSRNSSGSPFKYRVWGVDASTGQILWNKKYGGNQQDKALGVVEAYDNGFVIVGSSGTESVNLLVKTDQQGNTTY